MDYYKAGDETVKMVADVANRHHRHLGGHEIAVLMQEKASKSRGRVVMATTATPPKKLLPLLSGRTEFVICIAADTWCNLTPEQRLALVDHELCHCEFGEDGKPQLRGHDYEEFAEVSKRHGFWRQDYGEKLLQGTLIQMDVSVGTLRDVGSEANDGQHDSEV